MAEDYCKRKFIIADLLKNLLKNLIKDTLKCLSNMNTFFYLIGVLIREVLYEVISKPPLPPDHTPCRGDPISLLPTSSLQRLHPCLRVGSGQRWNCMASASGRK
jgi:hypothetical protein